MIKTPSQSVLPYSGSTFKTPMSDGALLAYQIHHGLIMPNPFQ